MARRFYQPTAAEIETERRLMAYRATAHRAADTAYVIERCRENHANRARSAQSDADNARWASERAATA